MKSFLNLQKLILNLKFWIKTKQYDFEDRLKTSQQLKSKLGQN